MTATRMKAVCRIGRTAEYIYRQPTPNYLNYAGQFFSGERWFLHAAACEEWIIAGVQGTEFPPRVARKALYGVASPPLGYGFRPNLRTDSVDNFRMQRHLRPNE